MTLITDPHAFDAAFPAPDGLEAALSIDGKRAYITDFVAARDMVETAYYEIADRAATPDQRARKFLAALINPAIGRAVDDVEHFYQTFGRLMRWAWLSISVGIYSPSIAAYPDTAERLHLAQANTVDLAWQAALARARKTGLLVEIGTGRGNSVTRMARLLPKARVISITISPEQAQITQAMVEQMGLKNVEIRCGDVFNPAVHGDLAGKADAVTAIEVTGHFAPQNKARGLGIFAKMLKKGAPLSIMDTAVDQPIPGAMRRYYENQSWYFGTRDGYTQGFEQAGAPPVAYMDYSPHVLQTFTDTTHVLRRYRGSLRRDFGWLLATIWPELPATVYLKAVQSSSYINVVGIKQ